MPAGVLSATGLLLLWANCRRMHNHCRLWASISMGGRVAQWAVDYSCLYCRF
jgi:hypothetical protein